ncbi:hypothetical protein BC835DRAFT_1525284 [Cytidiella melzeri]|nr:hypothetical protein BC835DRAFT_1525284 [Cytidiella melzeri]
MPGLHLATSVSLLSSIPAPTSVPHAKRDQYLPVPAMDYSPRTDPLDGSLGLFLVMCGLILLFILAVAILFWRIHVHRRARRNVTSQGIQEVREELPLPALLYNPESNASRTSVKFPPSLRIRSPIKNKLKVLKLQSSVGGVHPVHSKGARRPISKDSLTPSLPSIVVSECSPVIPSSNMFTPGVATSPSRSSSSSSLTSVTSTASNASLTVSGYPIQPQAAPLTSVDDLCKYPGVKRISLSGKAPRGANGSNGPARHNSRRGKENMLPPGLPSGVHNMTQLQSAGKSVTMTTAVPLANYRLV